MAKGEKLGAWIQNIGSAVNNLKGNNNTKGLFGRPSKDELQEEIDQQEAQMGKYKTYGMIGAVVVVLMCMMKK